MISMLSRRCLTNVREGPGFELVLLFCLRRCLVCFFFRWHPLSCLRGAGVVPVRGGGTYFLCSRAAAKKVSKESGRTPPVLVFTHGLTTSPCFAPLRANPCWLPSRRLDVAPALWHATSNIFAPCAASCVPAFAAHGKTFPGVCVYAVRTPRGRDNNGCCLARLCAARSLADLIASSKFSSVAT